MNPMMFRNYFYNKKNRNNVTSGSGVPGHSISNSNKEMIERKRTYDSEGPPTKRSALIHLDAGFTWNLQALTKAAEAVAQGGKSPVSALNELGVRVVYNLLDHRGPAHCPNFTVAVTVADMTFKGYGSSKRDARANAARACLNALLIKVGQSPLPVKMNIDFTSDFQCITGRKSPKPKKPKSQKSEKSEECENSEKSENSENSEESEKSEKSEKPVAEEKPKAPIVPREPSPQEPSLFSPKPCIPSHKSPINKLYEMYPTIEFATTYGDGSTLDVDRTTLNLNHSMRFKVVCRLNGMTYEGYGSSKKQAKLAASKAALASIISSPPEPVVDNITANSSSGIPQPLADHISKLVNEKFTELMQNDPVHLKRKVLAGIVMTIDNELEGAKIIAVTTGTKCVSGDKMSVSGRAVNDCHAEVAARRCLQRYLYKQLLMYADSPRPRVPIESSDIEPIPLAHAGYRLKANRQIHLYISTAPCGDGRIFSPHEEQMEPDRHPNRFSRGQLRTKIESGEGTIPVKNASLIQTWDGVLQVFYRYRY
ncbi:unnamed protein product [Colias eurytheme]|nr:unnamed protein product [Colias eurytheme]